MEYRNRNHQHDFDDGLDYSPLVISLCKIFEIEINLSLVHWFRKYLNIEMPTYFKKHKQDDLEYKLTPSSYLVNNPRPIDFNKGHGNKWIAPGIGESELIAQSFLNEDKLPSNINDYETLLRNWGILRQFRNKAAHTESLTKDDFNNIYSAFNTINENNILAQMNDLKWTFK